MRRLLYCLLAFLCVSCQRHGERPVDQTLSVAVYPYMQRMDYAERIIGEIWDRHNTGWKLDFKDWNCYTDGPRTDIDVFCIDCLFEQYYMNEGMINICFCISSVLRSSIYVWTLPSLLYKHLCYIHIFSTVPSWAVHTLLQLPETRSDSPGNTTYHYRQRISNVYEVRIFSYL